MVASPTTQLMGLSDVYLIGPKTTNLFAKQAEATAREKSQAAGIYIDTFEGYNNMCSFLFPEASQERLVALIMVMNFLYYVDEVYERHARQEPDPEEDKALRYIFSKCIQIMVTGEMPNEDHPLYRGSLAIHNEMVPLTNAEWLQRFLNVIVEHLKSTTYTLEDILHIQGGDPIEQYIALRELDGGMRPTMRMIEFANDFYLPDEIKTHPFIRRIEEPVASIGGLMNDIFSYEKEVIAYGSRFNLIALYEDHYDCSFAEAVHETVAVVNRYTADFLKLEKSIPEWPDEATNTLVRNYVRGLRHQVNATWYWQVSTDRYRSSTSPFPELRYT